MFWYSVDHERERRGREASEVRATLIRWAVPTCAVAVAMMLGMVMGGGWNTGNGRVWTMDRVGIGLQQPSQLLDLRSNSGSMARIVSRDEAGSATLLEIRSESRHATGLFVNMTESGQGADYKAIHAKTIGGSLGGYAGFFEGTGCFTGPVLIGGSGFPNFMLHVGGSAAKPGGGSWSNTSDLRLKKNVREINHALDTILALHGVFFEYVDPDAIGELHGEQMGMVAQEVEAVFPEWVDEIASGYKVLTFRGFEALAVEALRQLRAEKDAEIAMLHDRINALEAKLAD